MRRGELSLDTLPAWCALNDVRLFDVKFAQVDGKGYGLVAERNLGSSEDSIQAPTTLLTIPRDLVLSAEAVAEYAKVDGNFRQLLEVAGHQSPRQDILLFLMVQIVLASPDHLARGVVTPWTQYAKLLPSQVPVPTMWTEEELSHLRGTSLEHAVSAKLSVLSKEFDSIRAKSSSIPYWDELWAGGDITVCDWVLLDALYRSRSLELPRSGVSMVPCLDLVNHSTTSSACFEEADGKEEVSLNLNRGAAVAADEEISIDYGRGKSAAEMLFSYGFMDSRSAAGSIVLPIHRMDDDALAAAKLSIFGRPSRLEITDRDEGNPVWDAPFIYLMCLNEEDGLHFELLQETDGTRHLRLYWQEADVTDAADTFKQLIADHRLRHVFELRAITLVLEHVQGQLERLKHHDAEDAIAAVARAEVVGAALRLRRLEVDLLARTARVLEEQTDALAVEQSVVAYLGSVDVPHRDEAASRAANDTAEEVEEDFG